MTKTQTYKTKSKAWFIHIRICIYCVQVLGAHVHLWTCMCMNVMWNKQWFDLAYACMFSFVVRMLCYICVCVCVCVCVFVRVASQWRACVTTRKICLRKSVHASASDSYALNCTCQDQLNLRYVHVHSKLSVYVKRLIFLGDLSLWHGKKDLCVFFMNCPLYTYIRVPVH